MKMFREVIFGKYEGGKCSGIEVLMGFPERCGMSWEMFLGSWAFVWYPSTHMGEFKFQGFFEAWKFRVWWGEVKDFVDLKWWSNSFSCDNSLDTHQPIWGMSGSDVLALKVSWCSDSVSECSHWLRKVSWQQQGPWRDIWGSDWGGEFSAFSRHCEVWGDAGCYCKYCS